MSITRLKVPLKDDNSCISTFMSWSRLATLLETHELNNTEEVNSYVVFDEGVQINIQKKGL